MPDAQQNTSVTYESGGFPDGSKLKSGGPRSPRKQPPRGNRTTPAIGISSNIGVRRDYLTSMSNSSVKKRRVDEFGMVTLDGEPMYEVRRKERDEGS